MAEPDIRRTEDAPTVLKEILRCNGARSYEVEFGQLIAHVDSQKIRIPSELIKSVKQKLDAGLTLEDSDCLLKTPGRSGRVQRSRQRKSFPK
jgi:hypothetical protein